MSYEAYASVLIRLLQGVISYDDKKIWDLLLQYQSAIYDYFARMNLILQVNEADGYAFLSQPSLDEEGQPIALPRLTRKAHLSYQQTLLMVLLREYLDEFDMSQPESDRCIIHQDEIYERMRPLLPSQGDEKRLYEKMDGTIRQLREMGFLRELQKGSREYLIQRVLKSKINSEKLAEIREVLAHYADNSDEQS
jgi:hypothetical protein